MDQCEGRVGGGQDLFLFFFFYTGVGTHDYKALQLDSEENMSEDAEI